ncbi:MAG: hypothetical protein V4674_03125 [Patescibacteria group bacterium]
MEITCAFVADMVGSETVMRPMADLIERQGHKVLRQFALGKPAKLNRLEVESADMLVTGLTSDESRAQSLEIPAITAAWAQGEKVVGVLDVPDSAGRGATIFSSVAHMFTMIMVIVKEDVPMARKNFPNAQVVVVGSPEWERLALDQTTRSSVRESIGIDEQKKLVVVPGTKDILVNIPLFQAAITTVAEMAECDSTMQFMVALALHPGEVLTRKSNLDNILRQHAFVPNPVMEAAGKDEQSFYADLLLDQYRGSTDEIEKAARGFEGLFSSGAVAVRVFTKKMMPTEKLVVAADALIEYRSTVRVCAGFRKVPVVSYCAGEYARRVSMKNFGMVGYSSWEQGTYFDATDGSMTKLRSGLGALLEANNRKAKAMAKTQGEVYIMPKRLGESADRMANAAISLLG